MDRLNKMAFLRRIAIRSHQSYETVSLVYDAFIEELILAAKQNVKVSLTRLGLFYVQHHKGHPVQFGENPGSVADYDVVKFSASNVLNRRVRNRDDCALDFEELPTAKQSKKRKELAQKRKRTKQKTK